MIKSKYRYQVYQFDKAPIWYVVDCEVLEQTEKSYKIKILAHNVRGHKWGDTFWAKKRFVMNAPSFHDCTNEWWQK